MAAQRLPARKTRTRAKFKISLAHESPPPPPPGANASNNRENIHTQNNHVQYVPKKKDNLTVTMLEKVLSSNRNVREQSWSIVMSLTICYSTLHCTCKSQLSRYFFLVNAVQCDTKYIIYWLIAEVLLWCCSCRSRSLQPSIISAKRKVSKLITVGLVDRRVL